jgi:S-adenosyl-L-methionine hydrolase (adenosine-forming)
MSTPIITLTTDFGARDPWVGIMKGVILGICPAARLVDLSHVIGAQDVLDGALCLEAAVGFFPRGTIHLAVVDPGVGGTRRPMALQTGGQCYVGPDNGLFSLALERDGGRVEAVELTAREYRLSPVSRTFHGRDIFAPAAAHLASGVPLERLGRAMTDPVRLVLPSSRHEDGLVAGEVIGADRFGNLLTSVTEEDLAGLDGPLGLVVEIGGIRVGAPVIAYSDAPPGGVGAVVGSTGRLEVFVREGSAQAALGLGRGAPVVVKRA